MFNVFVGLISYIIIIFFQFFSLFFHSLGIPMGTYGDAGNGDGEIKKYPTAGIQDRSGESFGVAGTGSGEALPAPTSQG